MAKKTAKAKSSKRTVKTAKKVSSGSMWNQKVDNKLSILLLVLAALIFVLAATSMGR